MLICQSTNLFSSLSTILSTIELHIGSPTNFSNNHSTTISNQYNNKSNEKCLLTPKTTPPPLTSPPPAPTQPSKLTSLVTINLDPIELLFSTPPSSPSLLNVLGDLPPSTTNPSPPRLSFATIEHLENKPPPIPPMDSTFPWPTPELELTPPPLPPQCLPPPPSQLPPLLPLGPNNPFPLLTHEMFYEHCQRT
ncbi:hypothetical protein Tco_0622581 [Tanacetum coccineum]